MTLSRSLYVPFIFLWAVFIVLPGAFNTAEAQVDGQSLIRPDTIPEANRKHDTPSQQIKPNSTKWESGDTWTIRVTAWPARIQDPDTTSAKPVETEVRYHYTEHPQRLKWTWGNEVRHLRFGPDGVPDSIWDRTDYDTRPVRRLHQRFYQGDVMVFASEVVESQTVEPVFIDGPLVKQGNRTIYPREGANLEPLQVRAEKKNGDTTVLHIRRNENRWVLFSRPGGPWWRELRWFRRGRLIQRQVLKIDG